MPSLTHTEARRRADLITVTDTRIALDLSRAGDDAATEFTAVSTITFDARPGAQTFLDFGGVRLIRAELNGSPLPADAWADGRIRLTDLEPTNTVIVDGAMAYSSDGEGLHRHVDPADGNVYLYAMSFLDAAPRWFACFDQPDLKSHYRLDVVAPDGWTVQGNGPAEVVGGAPSTGSGDGVVWSMVPPHPLSTYFVTLIAGPYASVFREHDGIRLGVHVRASLAGALEREVDDIVTVTGQAFDYYHQIFGVRYPFGEYHQAFVPDFNAGAMENPGCVIFRDSFVYRSRATRAERGVRAGVIAHEMAHHWFGDLVTMRWWDDLWLNESFAEYLGHRCTTEATDYSLWSEFGITRKDGGYIADQAETTHPVAGNGAADAESALANFDGISYAKGAAVLRQLAGYLTDEVFLAGLRSYFAAHRFGNAEFADLVGAWSRAGEIDLGRWTEQWLRTAGVDTLSISARRDGRPALTRTAPTDRPADREHSVHVAGLADSGELIDPTPVVVGAADVSLESGDRAVAILPDAFDETWAKIRFAPDHWRHLVQRLGRIGRPQTRVMIWNSLRDQVRDSQLDPRDALSVIVDQLPAETEDVVLDQMFRFAGRVLAGNYLPSHERGDQLAVVHRLARSLLDASEPGADRQLIAFRTVVASCTDVDLLEDWRRRQRLPAGVELDADLTWAVVTRICRLSDRPDIIAETLAADTTTAATVNAARARAAIPTAEAKAAAYGLLTRDGAMPSHELYATAEAMFDSAPEQLDLTHAYALSFFDDIAGTAAFRSGWMLRRVSQLAFPHPAADPAVLAGAEQALARDTLPVPIRQVVATEIDGLRRAVAAQRRWPRHGRRVA